MNPLPIRCDVCDSTKLVYRKDKDLKHLMNTSSVRLWPWIWQCSNCNATVGCHYGTNSPLGFMANGYTRKLRFQLHSIIDPVWHSGLAKRNEVYLWLAKEFNLPEFHISQLSTRQLEEAIIIAEKFVTANQQRIKKLDKQRRKNHKA